jgi:hypothetical protein
MYNRRLSCLPWLPKQGRQVLLASVLCLLFLGLSAFSLAPSAHATAGGVTVQAGHANCSRAVRNYPWYYWSCDELNEPCCVGLSIHLHADGVYNPVIRQIWQWHVKCTSSGFVPPLGSAYCTWSGYFHNGTSVIQVGADGTIHKNFGDAYVGIRISIDADGGIVSDYQW